MILEKIEFQEFQLVLKLQNSLDRARKVAKQFYRDGTVVYITFFYAQSVSLFWIKINFGKSFIFKKNSFSTNAKLGVVALLHEVSIRWYVSA
jgi:hypothetical protein